MAVECANVRNKPHNLSGDKTIALLHAGGNLSMPTRLCRKLLLCVQLIPGSSSNLTGCKAAC